MALSGQNRETERGKNKKPRRRDGEIKTETETQRDTKNQKLEAEMGRKAEAQRQGKRRG